jgi:hypothetical protein
MSKNISEITKEEFIKVCEESNTKIEAYKRLGMHRNTFEKYLKLFGVEFTKKYKEKNKYDIEDILAGKYPYYNTSHLNYRLIKEGLKERRCEKCGRTHWFDEPIVLELHHIDGDRTNNSLENLQLLCPNCHAHTDNFKSKKMRHYKNLEKD